MFEVRSEPVPCPQPSTRVLRVRTACPAAAPRPPAFQPAPRPAWHAPLSTRQAFNQRGSAFNQPVTFNTSSVTDMSYIFFEEAAGLLCTDTCVGGFYASDGDCDDGGPGSEYGNCEIATDCDDCGSRAPSPPFGDPPASPPIPPGGPPPPRTGDGAGSAGDDPIFVGVDGLPYEVRGEAGWNFNLFSSWALSINAAFEAVPERFRALDITETVLGSLSLAVCSPGGAAALRFDVSSGNLTVRDRSGRADVAPSPSAEAAMARAAAGVVFERFECDLRLMSCRWAQRPVVARAEPLALPLVDSGFSRVRVEAASATATVTRHCMLSYDVEIDCTAFARWQAAADACQALLHGTAADDVREQWVMILSLASGLAADSRFYFMGLDVTKVVADSPADVHGLLGQRSVEAAVDGGLASASVGARGMPAPSFGPQGEGAIEGLYSDYRIGELDVHDSPWPFNRFTHCAGGHGPWVAVA